MNCSTFKKKLYDYMEANVVHDMKEAMEEHLKICESCRLLYEEERNLDDALRSAFRVEGVSFTSSRADILKNIDKNKYSNSTANRVNYHMKKYSIKYLASAAVLLLAFVMAPYISQINQKGLFDIKNSKGLNKEARIAEQDKMGIMVTMEDSNDHTISNFDKSLVPSVDMGKSGANDIQNFRAQAVYIPRFEKRERKEGLDQAWSRPSVVSPNGKLEATVYGKGEKAQEEGIGTIIITSKDTNQRQELYLIDNERQFTPTFVEWFDNETLLAVIAYGYGRTTFGGDVYLVNINTLKASLIYENEYYEQVMSVKRGNGVLEMRIKVFEDAQMDKSKDIDKNITFRDVSDNIKLPEVKTIYDFVNDIKAKNYTSALEGMTASFQRIHESKIGSLKNIQVMDIRKLIDMTDSSDLEESIKQNFDYKVYYAEITYKIENQKEPISSNTYSQKIILAREKLDSPWQISDIVIIPQN